MDDKKTIRIISLIGMLIALFITLVSVNIYLAILSVRANNEMRAAVDMLFAEADDVIIVCARERLNDTLARARTFDTMSKVATVLFGLISVAGTIVVFRATKSAMRKEREERELSQVILDSAPLVINLWDNKTTEDGEHKIVSTSRQVLELFGVKTQQEYLDTFYALSPELQPCGMPSKEKAQLYTGMAFRDGYARFEWLHQTAAGAPLPMDVVLVHFNLQGKDMLVSYAFDLRGIKSVMRKERESFERNQAILDSAPFVINLWSNELKLVSTSHQAVEMFGLRDQQQYLDDFALLSPTHQPCGTPSVEKAINYVKHAFAVGYVRFEWMHQTIGGAQIPTEVILSRFSHRDSDMLVAYTIDMRQIKKAAEQEKHAEIARRENHAKSRFLAQVSHDIRTPMNAILGITEIQLQNPDITEQLEEALHRIHSSSHLLLTLVNNLLDLSKVEAGKMEIIDRRYELASLIYDIVQMNIVYIGSKRIDFTLRVDPALPAHLVGDEIRIKQIFNNLLSNAFKYTNEGEVTMDFGFEMRADNTDDVVLVIRVNDTGKGMSREQVNRLFGEEYLRFDEESAAIEGTGLGFAITLRLIQMMDSDLTVDSEVGAGTRITVRLKQKRADTPVLGSEAALNLQNFDVSKMMPRKMRTGGFVYEPMPYGRVLIVDDVESNLYVAKGLLAPYGLKIDTASGGAEAIAKVEAGEEYDIIFMDHMMPNMDGIEAAKILRGMGWTHPIVALTANALVGQNEIFMQNGFSGFITKPIDMRLLNACLERFIRAKQTAEVVAAARQAAKGPLPRQISEIKIAPFLRDAARAAAALESFMVAFPAHDEKTPDADALRAHLIAAHSMKGVLRGIGETAAADAAAVLEQAARDADIAVIKNETPPFLACLREVTDRLSQLEAAAANADKDDAAEDTDFLHKQLAAIYEACEAYDTDAANSAAEAMAQHARSKQMRELHNEISLHLLHGAFEQAAAAAKKAQPQVVL